VLAAAHRIPPLLDLSPTIYYHIDAFLGQAGNPKPKAKLRSLFTYIIISPYLPQHRLFITTLLSVP
jgi:hypothetical protein